MVPPKAAAPDAEPACLLTQCPFRVRGKGVVMALLLQSGEASPDPGQHSCHRTLTQVLSPQQAGPMGASEESEALTLLAVEVQAQPRQGVFPSTAPFTWTGLTLVPNLAGGWAPGGRNTGCSSRDASPKFCLCHHMWTRHTSTLPIYKPRGLEWIVSKFLSLFDVSFIPGLVAAPEVGLGETKMKRVM